MVVVLGYLVAAGAGIVLLWLVAGPRYVVERDTSVDLGQHGARNVSILSGLAGFAVTGMVLLVTLGRNLPDTSATPYTTVLAMFFVSWMAYSGTGFLFASIHDRPTERTADTSTRFDVSAASYAGAATTLEIAFASGWLALRPLFQAFGLVRLAELAAGILIAASVASYGLLAQQLSRSGYGAARVVVAIPALTLAATVAYALIVGTLGLRTEDATLNLIVTTFILGAGAFLLLTTLPIWAPLARPARLLDRTGRFFVLAYVQAVVMMVGFLLLGVLGLA